MRLPKIGRGRKAPSDDELMEVVDEIMGEAESVVELEPEHDWRSFDEMMAIFECATSQEVWDVVVAWSASPIPGVRWHCDSCRWHTGGPTWLNRPTHCGSPMQPEACRWLLPMFDQRAQAIGVALIRSED